MLQAWLISYPDPDTHRHRLCVNYQSIHVCMPVNAKVNNYQRDCSMMVHANGGGAPNYFPHSFLGLTPSANSIWHSGDSVLGDVLISFPAVSSARRLVPMASGIVILCGVTFWVVRLETRTFFCHVENSFAVVVRLMMMLANA